MMKHTWMNLVLFSALILGSLSHQAQADSRTIGTVIGAVGGGLLGSTIGKGDGRVVATAAGTIFGAVLGHEIASNQDGRYEREPTYTERRRAKVVYVNDHKPRHKKNKRWKRVARYGDDILVCNKNGKRCQWYD